jgi:hypothetical protein
MAWRDWKNKNQIKKYIQITNIIKTTISKIKWNEYEDQNEHTIFSAATKDSNSSGCIGSVLFTPENCGAELLLPLDPKATLFATLLTGSPWSPEVRVISSCFLWMNSQRKNRISSKSKLQIEMTT